MAWDFSTEPEFQEQLDWVEEFCRTEIEPLDLVFPGAAYTRNPKGKALADPAQAAGEGPWPLGAIPRQGVGRSRLRATQAGADQRDPGPLRLGAGHLRHPGSRHRKHGDARGVRHRGAEAALAVPAHEPGDLVGLFDDRAAGRVGPEPVQDVTQPATARNGSSTARSGSPAVAATPTSSS